MPKKFTEYRPHPKNSDYFEGSFRVYLFRPQPRVRDRLTPGATMRNHVITVQKGSFFAGGGGITVRTGEAYKSMFYLAYDWVDIVVQEDGTLIWQNCCPSAPGR